MKDLIAKIGHFCENHVEKIVLVIAGAICVWLFFTRVIFSPNVVTVQGRNFTPGQIDRYVYEQAQELNEEMQRQRTSKSKAYTPRLTGPVDPCDSAVAGVIGRPLPAGFVGLFESPLSFIDRAAVPRTAPLVSTRYAESDRKYRLPLIPDVTDAAVSHIRTAAYVPRQELTMQTAYDSATSEPNDIDLVTVEARFDVAEVFRRYKACFNGVDVQKEEWRDPCLADPTFAAVQVQRRELLEGGTWSDWRPIPRSRIESNREMLTVVEQVGDLPPGGLDVRLMLFDRKDVALGLLQPESYQIASAEEDWFPPSLYGKFKDLQRKMEAEERKEQREQDRGQTDRGTDGRRDSLRGGGAQAGAARSGRGRGGQMGPGGDTGMRGARGGRGGQTGDPMMAGGARGRGGRRGGADDQYGDPYGGMAMGPDARRKASTDEVYLDLREEMLAYNADLSKQDKPVLIWAFDDTAEPGKVYRYRIRVGVFNPVAGTGQLVERDMDKKNQVILWSRFSEVPEPVSIPRMVYLFAKSVQDKTMTATVEVARYKLGYWRTEDFQVRPGESIGKSVEPKDPERERGRDRDRRLAMTQTGGRISDPRGDLMMDPMYAMPDPADASKPKEVDYTTGKVLLDLVEVNDWSDAPNLRPRMYHDMLYTSDGTSIEHMPVNMINWPRDLAEAYQVIQSEKRREPQPFRAFSKSKRSRGGMQDPYGGGAYDDMGGGGPYR